MFLFEAHWMIASRALRTASPGAETLFFSSGKFTLTDSISPFSPLVISRRGIGTSGLSPSSEATSLGLFYSVGSCVGVGSLFL
jgi:hypothetical protein